MYAALVNFLFVVVTLELSGALVLWGMAFGRGEFLLKALFWLGAVGVAYGMATLYVQWWRRDRRIPWAILPPLLTLAVVLSVPFVDVDDFSTGKVAPSWELWPAFLTPVVLFILSGTKITGTGFRHLHEDTGIGELLLLNTNLSEEGLRQILKLKGLTKIYVDANTAAALNKIKSEDAEGTSSVNIVVETPRATPTGPATE